MKTLLEKVINGELESVMLPFTPINEIENTLTTLGLNIYSSDTNGWEVDFWYYYSEHKNGHRYELSGSLYYGDFKFRKI